MMPYYNAKDAAELMKQSYTLYISNSGEARLQPPLGLKGCKPVGVYQECARYLVDKGIVTKTGESGVWTIYTLTEDQ